MSILLDSIVAAFDLRAASLFGPPSEEWKAVAVTMTTLALANHLAPRILHLRRDRQSLPSDDSDGQAVAALGKPARAVGVMKHDDDPVDEMPLAHGMNIVLMFLSHVPATAFLDRLSIQIHNSDEQQWIDCLCSLLNQRCQHLSVLSVSCLKSTDILLPTMCRLRNLFLYGPVSSSLLTESLAQSPAISLAHLDLYPVGDTAVSDVVLALSSPAASQLRTLNLNCACFLVRDLDDKAPSVFDALNRERLESLTVARLASEQAGLAASLVRFLQTKPERLHSLDLSFCDDPVSRILVPTVEQKSSDDSPYTLSSLQCLSVIGNMNQAEPPFIVLVSFPNLAALMLRHGAGPAPPPPEHNDSCLMLPRLRFMTITNSHLGVDEAIMSRLLRNNLFQLETLDLCSSTRLTGATCSRFFTARNCPHLRELSLVRCRGLASDLHLWTSPPALFALDLGDVSIPSVDAAAAFLAPLAATLNRLRICFRYQEFTSEFQSRTVAVLKLLNDCSYLVQLSVDGLTICGLLKTVFNCPSAAVDSSSESNNSLTVFKLVRLQRLDVDYDVCNDDDFDFLSQCCAALEEVSNINIWNQNIANSSSSLTNRGFELLVERCPLLSRVTLCRGIQEDKELFVQRLSALCKANGITFR